MATTNHHERYRLHWSTSFVLIVAVDTILTALAIESGLGIEGNPALAGLVHAGGYLGLAALKAVVMVGVWAIWYRAEAGRAHGWVPKFALGAGAFIVGWNLLNIALALVFM